MNIKSLISQPTTFAQNLISSPVQDNLLETLLSGSGIGLWVIELQSGRISFCPVAKQHFNISSDQEPYLRNILKAFDNLQRNLIVKTFENCCKENNNIDCDIKLISEQGEPLWLKIKGKLYKDLAYPGNNRIAGTMTDITSQKAAEQKKEDCIALLSHELRSPLTTVRLYLQRLISHGKRRDPATEMLKKADVQVTSMLRLMDSLLNASMVADANVDLHYEEFDIVSLVYELLEEMQLKFPCYLFTVEFQEAIWVMADKDKIVQVLINYIGNAVKYSPEHSTVTVKCAKIDGLVTVSVSDQGIGVDPAEQANLFGRYYRSANSGKKGCGLGLYLCKELIKLHNGDVWMESKTGRGSTFYFSLPGQLPLV